MGGLNRRGDEPGSFTNQDVALLMRCASPLVSHWTEITGTGKGGTGWGLILKLVSALCKHAFSSIFLWLLQKSKKSVLTKTCLKLLFA